MRLSHFSTLIFGAALLLPIAAHADDLNNPIQLNQTPVQLTPNDSDYYELQWNDPTDLGQYEYDSNGDLYDLEDDGGQPLDDNGQPLDGDPVGGSLAPTPEPSSMVLLGTGILGVGGILRRRQVAG